MTKTKNEPEFVAFRVPKNKKNRLELQAAQTGKTLSAFCRDAALFAADQNVAVEDKQPEMLREILRLLRDSQKMQYMIARLALKIGAEQTGSDEIMQYFRECQKDADEKYGGDE